MGWFNFWGKPKQEPIPITLRRTRFDDIEDDIKGLKSSLQAFVEDTEKALRKLKERVGSLEEKGEWKPRFGDRVRFRHSFFGEMTGVVMESPFPSQYQVAFHDPSNKGDVKFYTTDIKDMEKIDE
jgi:hypothetical protein